MQFTQTGLAVTLAIVVVALFFVLPGFSLFGSPAPVESDIPTTSSMSTTNTTNTQSMDTTTPAAAPLTELMMRDEVVGTGAAAAAGDRVTVKYVGSLTNGTVFDASAKHQETANGFPFTLGVGEVIKGWDEGVVGMKVGGKRLLAIPAALAYGSRAMGDAIPANSDLIFEVELLKVEKAD